MPQFDRLGNDMSDDIAEAFAMEEDYSPSLPEDDMYFDAAQEARDDEEGAQWGDARRCARHPHVKTSSDDGMFDGVCGECEGEGEEHSHYVDWMAELVASGPTCTDNGFMPWRLDRTCRDPFPTVCYMSQVEFAACNEIPF